jgi:threonyl-tRNA synthetase
MERFTGILIEHFGGAFPLWLAPVQAMILSISEKTNAYAEEVLQILKQADLRVEANLGSDKIGAKIRESTLQKVPYMLVVGEKEAQQRLVAVRTRAGVDKGQMPIDEFLRLARQEIAARSAVTAG